MFSLYLLLAIAAFGRPALGSPTGGTLGVGPDVQIFLWGLRWWPYALAHGLDPLHSQLVWPPRGVQVLWTTTVPLLSVLMTPITLTLGVAASWNLLVVLAPTAASWSAWLLCSELTGRRWPALLGGAVFGFSSFEAAEGIAHLQLSTSLLIPLAAYLLIRHARGTVSNRRLTWSLALIIVAQFLIAPELLVTMLGMGITAGIVALVVMPDRRRTLAHGFTWGVAGVGIGLVAVSPLLITMLLHRPAHSSAVDYPADLLNLVVPTPATALTLPWTDQIATHFPGNLAEQGAYLGVPILAIILAFTVGHRSRPRARLLTIMLTISVILSLGSRLTVDGHPTIWLPWSAIRNLPLLGDVVPVRFALYTSLIAAVMMADWLSDPSRRTGVRCVVAIAIAASLIPGLASWRSTPTALAGPRLKRALAHTTVLSLPFFNVGDRGLYAQEASGMSFTIIDNWLQLRPQGLDPGLRVPELAQAGLARLHGAGVVRFEDQLRSAGVTRLLVWSNDRRLLRGLRLPAERIGNVLIYRVPPSACVSPSCARSSARSSVRAGP